MNIVLKSLQIIFKLALSLALGVVLSVAMIKNDARIRDELTNRLNPFLSGLIGGTISFSVKNISLFPLSVELADVVSSPYSDEVDEWAWTCSSLTIGCSWFDLIFYGTVSLNLDMKELDVQTLLQKNGLCVWKIITRIMAGNPSIPIYLQALKISDAHLHIDEPQQDLHADAHYALTLNKLSTVLHGDVDLVRANGIVRGRKVFENMNGPVSFDAASQLNKIRLCIGVDCTLDLPALHDDRTCRLVGLWNYDNGLFSLKNQSGTCVIDPIKLYVNKGALCGNTAAQFPASYAYSLAMNDAQPSPLTGECTLQAEVKMSGGDLKVQADVTANSVCYGTKTFLSTSTLSCTRDQGIWDGKLSAQLDGVSSLVGSFMWNEQSASGSCHLNNDQQVNLPGVANWCFLPKTVALDCVRAPDGRVEGSCTCTAKNQKTGIQLICSGKGLLVNDLVDIHGAIDGKSLRLTGSIGAQLRLHRCSCSDAQGNTLVDVRAHKSHPEHFMGTVSLGFVKEMLKRIADIDFQGQGTVECAGMIQEKKLYTQIKLLDGSVRIPYTCNVVNGLKGKCIIDPVDRSVEFRDMHCALYRGTLDCQRARIVFDHNYIPTFVHVPLLLHDCLFNWKKDLFAIISGRMLFKHVQGMGPMVSGNLLLDRAQLKRNIFSQDFQRSFLGSSGNKFLPKKGSGISLDLHVTTKNPVCVKTAFLETSAKLDLAVKGSFSSPDLTGRISLVSGNLIFPYKPLYITKGFIDFVPGHLSDPYIEISAKNKLKKYNVSLDVSGSFNEQEILLEASPSLTEEQIVALLFAGSEQGSLNILMPALVMQNIKNIIFGSDQSPTGIRKAFGYLFKPLERVHLVPSFTDQTGRGGLRAAVEIDVSDRCRAMIQKNFSLTEDTKVEVDYALSDDVNLRGVRDERGDVSAEVEMRWKF